MSDKVEKIPELAEVPKYKHWRDTVIGTPAGGEVALPGVHQRSVKEVFDGTGSTVTREDVRELGKVIRSARRGYGRG